MLLTALASPKCISGATFAALVIYVLLHQLQLQELYNFLIEAVVMTIALPALLCLTQQHFAPLQRSSIFKKCLAEEDETRTNHVGSALVSDVCAEARLKDDDFEDRNADLGGDTIWPTTDQDGDFLEDDYEAMLPKCADLSGDTIGPTTDQDVDFLEDDYEALLQNLDLEDFEEDPQAVADYYQYKALLEDLNVSCHREVATANGFDSVEEDHWYEEAEHEELEADEWWDERVDWSDLWEEATSNNLWDDQELEANDLWELEAHDLWDAERIKNAARKVIHSGPSRLLLQAFREAASANGVEENYKRTQGQESEDNFVDDGNLALRDDTAWSMSDQDHEDLFRDLDLDHYEEDPQAVADYYQVLRDLGMPCDREPATTDGVEENFKRAEKLKTNDIENESLNSSDNAIRRRRDENVRLAEPDHETLFQDLDLEEYVEDPQTVTDSYEHRALLQAWCAS